ncbi:hypothetical protein EII17_07690 [Clostridiales bacterium COT073_COT-073]|nr:hypothetical protein EII17_07690 [Clostridiales bacterium COT073_COT-073]
MKKIMFILLLFLVPVVGSFVSKFHISESSLKDYVQKDLKSDNIEFIDTYSSNNTKIIFYRIKDSPLYGPLHGVYVFKSGDFLKDYYFCYGKKQTNQKWSFYTVSNNNASKEGIIIIFGRNQNLEDKQLSIKIDGTTYIENIETKRFYLFIYPVKNIDYIPEELETIKNDKISCVFSCTS